VLHHPDTHPFARELLAELYTERGFAAFVIADNGDPFHQNLASGKHHGEVNFIPVLDRPGKFVGISALKVQIDFNDVGELPVLGEKGGLHRRVFSYHVLQAFTDGFPVNLDHFLAVRELPERQMKIYLNSHVSFLLVSSLG
jgi:hypothetical protein